MRLARNFYARPVLELAPELLGKYLVFQSPHGQLVGKINEVEAYLGEQDPASHAFRGQTTRNSSLFLDGGHSYVYFTYGMHYCLNIVAETAGVAGGALIRSVIPIEGLEIMRANRNGVKDSLLANGPGKLCQAFGINRSHNGLDLVTSPLLWLEEREKATVLFHTTPRIGIRTATEKLWRFVMD